MLRKGKFVVIQAIIFYRGNGGIAPIVLTLSSKWSAAHSGHFTPGEIARGTHWIGGWLSCRAALNILENI